MKYIIEPDLEGLIEYAIGGANTIQDLQRYLSTDPHPKYRLASCQFNYGRFLLIWEEVLNS